MPLQDTILNSKQLLEFVVDKADDMKAVDIIELDVSESSSITDFMVICSGTSKRHVHAIANNVNKEARAANLEIIGMEGHDVGEWVLLDLGDVVLHVMQEQTRDFYQLEKLWG